MSNKPKLIIVDGAQGVGKSTVCRAIREKLTSTLLFSLSGVADKTEAGAWKSYEYHSAILNTVFDISRCDLNVILERSHLSERVFCALGYKPYTFIEQTKTLNAKLKFLTSVYDVHVAILTCHKQEYEDRLKRDKGEYFKFDAESSIKQEDIYLLEMAEIEEAYPAINCYEVDTTGLSAEEVANLLMMTIF